jgi:hypothetical protein
MPLIVRCFETGLLVWLALLAAIVIGRVLNGDIDATGLLQHGAGDGAVAPERVVSMLAFPVVLVTYVLNALHADVSVHAALPDLSDNMILLLTGGNGLYLAGKIART